MPEPVITERLRLVPATGESMLAERYDPRRFGELIEAALPADWPPAFLDQAAMTVVRRRLVDAPEQSGWWLWFAILRESREVVGTVGFVGPPEQGEVEVGYSFIERVWNQGLATEAVGALLAWALADQRVERIIAQTLADGLASQRVLAKLGFARRGAGREPGSLVHALERRDWLERT